MRLIDADEFLKRYKEAKDIASVNPMLQVKADGIIEDTPTVDAAPVVRCKNCVKHYTVHCTLYIGETRDEYGNSTCHYCGATARDDFFCPDGEAENESIPKHQKTTIDDSEYEDIKCNLKCDECSDRNYCDYPDLKEGRQ